MPGLILFSGVLEAWSHLPSDIFPVLHFLQVSAQMLPHQNGLSWSPYMIQQYPSPLSYPLVTLNIDLMFTSLNDVKMQHHLLSGH